ncbi:MAG: hypothetical protein CVU57_10930 [Deltaproteobacteria bacterium HGW-Deltaproteobacteria-15]|jgi:hypothetical protein|nr:MAG: hypothetical protein CVU57_10930 [Deltaproteobacteria bacterium HGW-Deltaproteobacteria-15]
MKTIKISLVNNDQVVQATKNLNLNESVDHSVAAFIRQIREELVTGETAYLEIQGLQKDPLTFAISQCEW